MMKDELRIDGVDYIKKDLVRDEDEEDEEVEYVEIPDNININKYGQIVFNNRKQAIRAFKGDYVVMTASYGYHNENMIEKINGEKRFKDYSENFCLMRCSREDLEHDDTAFHDSSYENDFTKLRKFCKILDEERYVEIMDKRDVFVDEYNWDCWWKLVRKDEVKGD